MNRTTNLPLSASGFSLVDVMAGLLVVSLAALLLVQVSRSNAATRAQSLARASAVRLGTELAEWTRRGGHHHLDMPLAQALDATGASASADDCHDPESSCDARQAARGYLARWRARLLESIGDARLLVCAVSPADAASADWSCAADGVTQVLKIGRSWRGGGVRPAAIIDLGAAP
jgi:Tfp pilus assembly protein PilV